MRKLLVTIMLCFIFSAQVFASSESTETIDFDHIEDTIDDITYKIPFLWLPKYHDGFTVYYPDDTNADSFVVIKLSNESSLTESDALFIQTAVINSTDLDDSTVIDRYILNDREIRNYFYYIEMNKKEYAVYGYMIPVDKGRVLQVEEYVLDDTGGFMYSDDIKYIVDSITLEDGTKIGNIEDAEIIKDK